MEKHYRPSWLTFWIGLMMASWPFNLILGKVALRYFPAPALASFRLIAAAILMLPIYWLTRSRILDDGTPKPRLEWRDIKTFAQLGVLGVVVNQGAFVIGLNYTTVGHSALIMGVGPITVFILAWAHGLEVATARKIAGLLIALTGVIVLTLEKGLHLRSGTLSGDLITLCGSTAFAVYTVAAKKVSWKYDPITLITFAYGVSVIVLLPVALYGGLMMTRNDAWSAVHWKGWAGLAYLTVFGSVVAFLLYTWALRYMTASRMGALIYAHPVVATGLGILWLGETVTRNLVIGGALILMGMYLIQSGREPVAAGAISESGGRLRHQAQNDAESYEESSELKT